MRRLKSSVAVILAFLFLVLSFSYCLSAKASDISAESDGALWADGNPNYDSADKNAIDVVKWYSESDKGKAVTDLTNSGSHFYLLLPTTADLTALKVWHTFSQNPTVNEIEIVNGELTDVFSSEGDYTLNIGDKSVILTVMKSKSIGSMYITTESGSMSYVHADKENKEAGNILVVESDGTVDYDKALDQIKGRGNTTWTNMEKKPYNIKLNKKASLLGMDASKKWCLLANGQDHSLIRNKIAYDLAEQSGLIFSPASEYVDLYLNNEYVGIYQVSEKVEIGDNNLVKINDLEGATEDVNSDSLDSYVRHSGGSRPGRMNYYEIPNNPDDITGGYLLEYEVESKYKDEPCGFITDRQQYVVIKGPEYTSKEQTEYISSFVQDMEDAIYSETGYNDKGKHYTEYIDAESAALMYLIQEYSVNIDCGITSCFFYKDSDLLGDGKIHAGPAWDFDVAFGNLENSKDGVSMMSTNDWFAKNSYQYGNGQKTIFAQLCTHNDFMQLTKEVYNTKFLPALEILNSSEYLIGENIKSYAQYQSELQPSAAMNFERWSIEDNLLVKKAGNTYESQMQYLVNFLSGRKNFLTKEFSNSDTDTDTDSDTDVEDIITIYFDNNVHNWDNVYLFYWGEAFSKSWPGNEMTSVGDNIYKFEFPKGINKNSVSILFDNGYGNGRQTVDLSLDKNGMIFVPNEDYSRVNTDGESTIYYYEGEWRTYEPISLKHKIGDINGDEKITVYDASAVQKAALSLVELNEEEFACADVNFDERITISDAIDILKYSVGVKTNPYIGSIPE